MAIYFNPWCITRIRFSSHEYMNIEIFQMISFIIMYAEKYNKQNEKQNKLFSKFTNIKKKKIK